ncbi:MAG: hypothetical protein LAN64_14625 [Acidobacteriia bacterium]|nr:hypothetical protein [Terriglobia bacterium]
MNGCCRPASAPSSNIARPRCARFSSAATQSVRGWAECWKTRRAGEARDAYGDPVRHYRSTEKSALIVAGSAGTGAAMGAIAGGGATTA